MLSLHYQFWATTFNRFFDCNSCHQSILLIFPNHLDHGTWKTGTAEGMLISSDNEINFFERQTFPV